MGLARMNAREHVFELQTFANTGTRMKVGQDF